MYPWAIVSSSERRRARGGIGVSATGAGVGPFLRDRLVTRLPQELHDRSVAGTVLEREDSVCGSDVTNVGCGVSR